MKDPRYSLERWTELLQGRRVVKLDHPVYPPSEFNEQTLKADWIRLHLDDGSEVIILDEWGFTPLIEQDKPPHAEPLLWEGSD